MIKKVWVVLVVLVGLAWVFRRPLEQLYARRITGLQAAQDAAIENRYTTYNTQLYTEPFWRPLLNFFKASAYVPAGNANQGGGQPVDYSVQG